MSDYFYQPAELAKMLKVSERTIRRWVYKGDLPAFHFGRQLRIPASALEKFVRSATHVPLENDWLAKCRAARETMSQRGDSAKLIRQIRLDKAER